MIKKKGSPVFCVSTCIAVIFLLMLTCGCADQSIQRPKAVKGVLDLTQWDFTKKDQLALDGEWRVFWNQLLIPDQIAIHTKGSMGSIYQFPGTWNTEEKKDPPLSGIGYATFVLEILTPDATLPLSIHIQEILSAYTLWADNKIVSTRGLVGANQQTSKAEFRPDIIPLQTHGNKISLVLQISNFQHRKGGPWTSIQLGRTDAINASANVRLFINIFLAGSIFMVGLYHLSMFLLGNRYRSYVYFGLFCLLISIRSIATNERYLHILFSDLSWSTLMRIEYLTFYLSISVFGLFIHSVFPREFSKKVLFFTNFISLVFAVIVCATPVMVFSHTIQTFQTITFLLATYLFFVFLTAYKKKREGAVVNLIGFAILFITIINDILYVNEMMDTMSLIPLGMLFFILSQAFMLSLIYSEAFKKVEFQKEALTETNQALSKEIDLNKVLQVNLVQSHEKFQKSRLALILGLAKLSEYRDEDTGLHLKRMREFSILLAIGLSKTQKYKTYITREYIDDIYQSSILHDIGKVGIKDAILLKPGKLTAEEFEEIKTHSTIGGDAITAIESEFKATSFLTLGKNIAYSHHEKWDGTGYPKGLKKEDIPLSARIVAVADVYDALTSERPYKKAFSHEKSTQIIRQGRANHFDPEIVDIFLTLSNQFKTVRSQFPE